MSIPMPDGSLYRPSSGSRAAAAAAGGSEPRLTPVVDDATFRTAPTVPAQVHAPILGDGSGRYSQGSLERVWFPLTDGLPQGAEVEDGGTWRQADVIAAAQLPAYLVSALTSAARRQATGAVVVVGSPGWPAGLRRLRVRLHDGSERPVREHHLLVV